MNEIVNKFLLPGDKFMPEMYLRLPGHTYNAFKTFTEKKGNKCLKKQEIQDTYIKMKQIKFVST